MEYSRACELLGFTTPKSLEANARLARNRLSALTANAPLKHKVACMVLIDAAKGSNAATYTNKATCERYELGLEVLSTETRLEVAWGRGLKAACQVRGWNRFDVSVSVQ